MKVGLLFGSFNPIHTGHLIIANHMAHFTDLNKVWFVVSPHNPLKEKKTLINTYDRIEMIRIAIEDQNRLAVSDIELKLPQPSYTIDTLTYLKEKFPDKEFVLLMGSDNLAGLHKWKNYEMILRDYEIYVYPRTTGQGGKLEGHPSIKKIAAPIMEISASFIREAIQNKKSIRFLVPDKVIEFMESKGLYRKR